MVYSPKCVGPWGRGKNEKRTQVRGSASVAYLEEIRNASLLQSNSLLVVKTEIEVAEHNFANFMQFLVISASTFSHRGAHPVRELEHHTKTYTTIS